MSVRAAQTTVTTSATRLDATGGTTLRAAVLIRNRGSVAVFVGNSTVTTSTGFQLDPGESISVDLDASDAGIYGIVASGTNVCHLLQAGT